MSLQKTLGAATRDAYGQALVEAGKANSKIVVLDADLASSTRTGMFAKVFPDRFVNVGIAEQNLVGLAGGIASTGLIPFISSFSCFLTCRGYDQLRMAVAYPNLNVKIVASHGGISVGEDGVSQQSIEDYALMTSLPNFIVMVPSDEHTARALIHAAVEHVGPVYMRTSRPKSPVLYTKDTEFEIGKGMVLREGCDVTLIATGLLVWESLAAAEELASKGIQATVVDIHTLKPLDTPLLTNLAKKTGAFVISEEHQIWGGLSSAVARTISQQNPVPMEYVAIQDTYAESGKPEDLMEKYGLTARHIVSAAQRVVKRK
ncbi:MAG: transketolase family protein [Candidatus Omnitrophica bacterium]|nr:transketolase family protein [Candidatus Omnitrophota bacterium]